MRPERIIYGLNLYDLFETALPDLVLSFTFFTSISYAVLSRQFEKQRPTIAMSVSIGCALSMGLVWWEHANDLSIKNLGPLAIGFAILILAFIMYKSISHVGGSWAGAGITVVASIIIAQILKIDVPIDSQVIQTITIVALLIGIIAFVSRTQGHSSLAAL